MRPEYGWGAGDRTCSFCCCKCALICDDFLLTLVQSCFTIAFETLLHKLILIWFHCNPPATTAPVLGLEVRAALSHTGCWYQYLSPGRGECTWPSPRGSKKRSHCFYIMPCHLNIPPPGKTRTREWYNPYTLCSHLHQHNCQFGYRLERPAAVIIFLMVTKYGQKRLVREKRTVAHGFS